MEFEIKITPLAQENIREAIAYYKENASLKIVQKFIQDYELTLNNLYKTPYFRTYYKNFRGIPLKFFPYIVFYQVNFERKQILIKGVFNTYQNPTKYPK